MANQSIGTPRFYLDFTQLASAKGFWKDPFSSGHANTTNIDFISGGAESGAELYSPENMNVWNFDYVNPTQYYIQDNTGYFVFRLAYWDLSDENTHNLEWAKLISTANFCGIINHNIRTRCYEQTGHNPFITAHHYSLGEFQGVQSVIASETLTDIANSRGIDYDGYSLISFPELSEFANPSDYSAYSAFQIQVSLQGTVNYSTRIDIGAMTLGKFIDIPTAPDLSVTKSVEYDGVKITKSLNGSDFVQVNHQGQPDWLVGEPWTLKDYASSGRIGRNGRRTWDLSFSYISNDDLFYDLNERVVGGSATISDGDETAFNSTSEMQQIWDLTLGGALSFIFCPDPSATNLEFAVCKLDMDSLQATQVAFQVWNVSMRVMEVW